MAASRRRYCSASVKEVGIGSAVGTDTVNQAGTQRKLFRLLACVERGKQIEEAGLETRGGEARDFEFHLRRGVGLKLGFHEAKGVEDGLSLAVTNDLRIGCFREDTGALIGVFNVAGSIDEVGLGGVLSRDDASIGERIAKLVIRDVGTGFFDDFEKALVGLIDHALDEFFFVWSHFATAAEGVFEFAAGEDDGFHAQLLEEVLVVHGGDDDSDATGHGGAVGEDFVGPAGDVEASRGGHGVHVDDDRFDLGGLLDVMVNGVCCGDFPAGRVHAKDDGFNRFIEASPFQFSRNLSDHGFSRAGPTAVL